MKIKHYLYNTFLIEDGQTKIAVDPGQNLWLFKLRSLIPKAEWESITHILITHADPDHYWQSDRVAEASNAHVICGEGLTKIEKGKTVVIDPRGRELTSWIEINNLHALKVGDSVTLDDVIIEAIKSVHGPIVIPFLGFKIIKYPGINERVGLGAIGFKITINNKTLVNLGDSILLEEWKDLKPDVLMLPIGGNGNNVWTMDVEEALEAVKLISPHRVIPCHYDNSFFCFKNINPADDQLFKHGVEQLGIECTIMKYGEEIEI
jgi:L-ascorbate metabolism protein UlaG (beta-lactamase superfamily)